VRTKIKRGRYYFSILKLWGEVAQKKNHLKHLLVIHHVKEQGSLDRIFFYDQRPSEKKSGFDGGKQL